MEVLRDGVLAFLAAVGLTTLAWMAVGLLFHTGRPWIPGLLLVLPVTGQAPALEADLRELRWLRTRLPGAKLLVADCGLDPETRKLAQYLTEREPGAALVRGEDPIIT